MNPKNETSKLLENDKLLKEEGWEQVCEVIGKDATIALKELYSLFDERLYLWLADLYDPITGGFYCTNAARDNQGYLPDIQSTAQALAFLNNSGMSMGYGGWEYALPTNMTDAIAEFVKGLQSPKDGYIYHPQWEGMKYTASRLGRDVNWVSEILRPLYNRYLNEYTAKGYSKEEIAELLKKYMPYWDTPAGLKGSMGKPNATVTSDQNVVASTWTSQFRSLDAWRAYLYGGTADGISYPGIALETDSYTAGNRLAAQTTQIKQRDREARENGEPFGYAELTKEFLDNGVKAHNGLWEDDIKYNSVNGLMKIVSVYNGMRWELPYPDKAIQSAISIANLAEPDIDGKEPIAAVDVYNPWVCISGIFINISNHNQTLDTREFELTWRSVIKENAASMIRRTTAKIKKFAKDDGSFGYHWGAPSAHAQGMPVTVPGIVCGDVDGACLSSTGTLTRIQAALDIKEISPKLFSSCDLEKFIKRVEEKILSIS